MKTLFPNHRPLTVYHEPIAATRHRQLSVESTVNSATVHTLGGTELYREKIGLVRFTPDALPQGSPASGERL